MRKLCVHTAINVIFLLFFNYWAGISEGRIAVTVLSYVFIDALAAWLMARADHDKVGKQDTPHAPIVPPGDAS